MQDKWTPLRNHQTATAARPILSLFEIANRAQQFSVRAGDMMLDYSKTNIDAAALALLLTLAESSGVAAKRTAMFSGEKINDTEGRAVLHTALRTPASVKVMVDGVDVIPEIHAIRARMTAFVDDVRSGRFVGQGGKITDVVNIGIGGSDLGPVMATIALSPWGDGPRIHYVSNVDGAHIADTLKGLNPETTLIIVASKTFTTIETMTNADTAKRWLAAAVTNPGAQFAAVSTAAVLPPITGDSTGAIRLQNASSALQWILFAGFVVFFWVRILRDDLREVPDAPTQPAASPVREVY